MGPCTGAGSRRRARAIEQVEAPTLPNVKGISPRRLLGVRFYEFCCALAPQGFKKCVLAKGLVVSRQLEQGVVEVLGWGAEPVGTGRQRLGEILQFRPNSWS